MTLRSHITTALAIILAFTTFMIAAVAADWRTYENDRYRFSVKYPADLFHTVEYPANGDGIVMKSRDGAIELRTYAFLNVDGLSMRDVRRKLLSETEGRRITYRRTKGSWMVISGYENTGTAVRDIFYQRIQAAADRSSFSVFEIIYPENRRSDVDRLIKRMSLSLTPPAN